MKNYVLTLRLSFRALDDVEARKRVEAACAQSVEELLLHPEGDVRLTEIYAWSPPRHVRLPPAPEKQKCW